MHNSRKHCLPGSLGYGVVYRTRSFCSLTIISKAVMVRCSRLSLSLMWHVCYPNNFDRKLKLTASRLTYLEKVFPKRFIQLLQYLQLNCWTSRRGSRSVGSKPRTLGKPLRPAAKTERNALPGRTLWCPNLFLLLDRSKRLVFAIQRRTGLL